MTTVQSIQGEEEKKKKVYGDGGDGGRKESLKRGR
jgi:hypothetical protein